MIITPSILTNTADDVFSQIEKLSPFFNYFQIDIADGIFVQNKTVSMEEIVQYIQDHANTLQLDRFYFDFHLMVTDYKRDMELLNSIQSLIKVKNVFIHIKLHPDYDLLKREFPHYVIGLVFNLEDNVQYFSTEYRYSTLEVVQVMSVEPGKQGGSFIPDSLQKFDLLRENGYRNKIFLDGAVNNETLPVILSRKIKPDAVGPGSYLSKAENITERVQELKEICLKAGTSPILKVT